MRVIFLIVLSCIALNSFSQEKRLALVIGNADYTDDKLKNPVNDALLMKETLEKLDFDVLLDTNLKTRSELLNSIYKFGERRNEYDVGFVYYAGHGVQINGSNYLLATQEKYETEVNVEDNGVNVSRILGFFNEAKNQINILVLDACRNNPFEKNWLPGTRALDNGLGLAPLNSSGNIIAFSTATGTKAADGESNVQNSPYCLSLVKNMLTPDLDLDQLFRNVRREMREISNGNQLPTVDNQYEGNDFYFSKTTFTDQIIVIDSLIEMDDFEPALDLTKEILFKAPSNKLALLRRGRIEYHLNMEYDGLHLFLADSIYPNDIDVLEYLGRYCAQIGDYEKAINYIDSAIHISRNDVDLYYWKATFHEENNQFNLAEESYTQAIKLDSTEQNFLNRARFYEKFEKYLNKAEVDYTNVIKLNPKSSAGFTARAEFYTNFKEDYNSALSDYNEAVKLEPNNTSYLYSRGNLFSDYFNDSKSALADWEKVLLLDSSDIDALNAIGLEYEILGDTKSAVIFYSKGIELANVNIEFAYLPYSNRAYILSKQGKLEDAEKDLTDLIKLNPSNAESYFARANFYTDFKEDYSSALTDYNEAIRIEPTNIDYLYARGLLFFDYLLNTKKALEDFEEMLKIDPKNIDAINMIGVSYGNLGDTIGAINNYTKGIEYAEGDSELAYYCYLNRAYLLSEQGKLDEAEKDYTYLILLNPLNAQNYYARAYFYSNFKEDYSSALDDFNEAIRIEPTNLDYLYARGLLFFDYLLNTKKALEDFEEILKMDPNNINAINYIGLIYEEQDNIEKAINFYTEGIEKYPIDAEAISYCYNNRGLLFEELNKKEEALMDYSMSIEYSEDKSEDYYTRALFFLNNEQFESALIDLSLAIDYSIDEKSLYYNERAFFYKYYLKNYNAALKDYEAAFRLDTLNRESLLGICDIKKSNGEFTEALELLDKWHVNNQISDSIKCDYYITKGSILSASGEYEAALEFYSKSIDLIPNNSIAYYKRGEFYHYYLNDLSNALKDYTLAIQLDPTNIEYLLKRSDIYYKLNETKNQLNDIKAAQKNEQESFELISKEVYALSLIGEINQAIKIVDKLIKDNSNNYQSYLIKAKVLIKKGEYNNALEYLEKAKFYNPNDPEIYFLVGKVQESNKEYYEASHSFSIAGNKCQKGLYALIDELGNEMEEFEMYYQIGKFYENINEFELMCDYYKLTLDLINMNQIYSSLDIKLIIQEKLKNCLD
jgi:tetratricopeptide (TPR) repeat protein